MQKGHMNHVIGLVAGTYSSSAPLAVSSGFDSHSVAELALTFDGFPGDRHCGATRRSGPREPWLARGTWVRNDRQLSIVSAEELAILALALEIPHIDAGLIGANLLVTGLTHLSQIAPGSHLAFGGIWGGRRTFDGGAVLRVEAYNQPCRKPGRKLAAAFARPALEFSFVKQAAALRGLVLSVAHPGRIVPGDSVVVISPSLAPGRMAARDVT
jgi:MOSC domain